MQIQPVVKAIEAALFQQASLAGADPAVEAAMGQLVASLAPALRLAAMELAEQAAVEVGAQLPEHTIDVTLVDGAPSLRVSDRRPNANERGGDEELDARITLRLPPSLKQLVEEAAINQGDSVNGWVVDVLNTRAKRHRGPWSASHRELRHVRMELVRTDHRFAVDGHARLDIDIPAGSVRVENGPVGSIVVAVDSPDTETVDVSQLGSSVSIRQSGRWFGRSRRVSVVATAPEGTELIIATASADIRVIGQLGAIRARTASGDIEVEHGERLELDAVSGTVRVDRGTGALAVSTTSGDIVVRQANARVGSTSTSGDIRIDQADGDVEVNTTSGDIAVHRYSGEDISLRSVSGGVTIGLPTGIRVEPDISTLSGKTTLPAATRAATSDSAPRRWVRVRVRTISGDIRVDRV